MNPLPGQMELATVIDHGPRKISAQEYMDASIALVDKHVSAHEATHKPAGVRLAKMLRQCEESPSSQLWSDVQRLATEILRDSK